MGNSQIDKLKLGRILLVDDVSINREILRNHLESSVGCADEAGDGFEALELFRRHRYDAVILDIEMPGMDGYAALRAMRSWEQEHTQFPTLVLAMTASDFPDDEQRILAAGATAYLAKPVRKQKLMAALGIAQAEQAEPHPMVNLLPGLMAYAGAMLNEIEAEISADNPAVSKKFHELRGSLATFGFNDLAERLRQLQLMAHRGERLAPAMFEVLRNELSVAESRFLRHSSTNDS